MKHPIVRWAIVILLIVVFALPFLNGCNDTPDIKTRKADTKPNVQSVPVPKFFADSAYRFIEKQVEFGPRIPGSTGHQACGDWMVGKLKSYGANIIEQKGNVTIYDGKSMPMRNIIAEFNPQAQRRIVLAAHWDTRPFGDKDTDESLRKKPIDGANDGGSGVGVLMEIARLLQANPVKIGVDLIFFDVEDYGAPEWSDDVNGTDIYTWCLGSQYWMRQPHKMNYRAETGILLDMVGAKNAVFNKEGKSLEAAPGTVARVWSTAERLGYGGYFQDMNIHEIVDDHQYMNLAGIPTIDIVDMRPGIQAMGLSSYVFGDFHHTHNDNMSVIDRKTLEAVGTTVTHVLYNF